MDMGVRDLIQIEDQNENIVSQPVTPPIAPIDELDQTRCTTSLIQQNQATEARSRRPVSVESSMMFSQRSSTSRKRIKHTSPHLTAEKVRLPVQRDTPVSRNAHDVHNYFVSFLRSDRSFKESRSNTPTPLSLNNSLTRSQCSLNLSQHDMSYVMQHQLKLLNISRECSFTPSLNQTQQFNQTMTSITNESTYDRLRSWKE